MNENARSSLPERDAEFRDEGLEAEHDRALARLQAPAAPFASAASNHGSDSHAL